MEFLHESYVDEPVTEQLKKITEELKKKHLEVQKKVGKTVRTPSHTWTCSLRHFEIQVLADFTEYYSNLFASEMSAVNEITKELRALVCDINKDQIILPGAAVDQLCHVALCQFAAWRNRPAVIGLGLKLKKEPVFCMRRFLGMQDRKNYADEDLLTFAAYHSKMLVSLQALDEYGSSNSELMAELNKAFSLFEKMCSVAADFESSTDGSVDPTDDFISTPNFCILPCAEDADLADRPNEHDNNSFYNNLYEHFNRLLSIEDKRRLAILANDVMAGSNVNPKYSEIVAAYKEHVKEQDARMIVRLIKATATAPVERTEGWSGTKPARQPHGLIAMINIPGLNKIIVKQETLILSTGGPEKVLIPPVVVVDWIKRNVKEGLTNAKDRHVRLMKGMIKDAFDEHYTRHQGTRDITLEEKLHECLMHTVMRSSYQIYVIDLFITEIETKVINWFTSKEIGAKENHFTVPNLFQSDTLRKEYPSFYGFGSSPETSLLSEVPTSFAGKTITRSKSQECISKQPQSIA